MTDELKNDIISRLSEFNIWCLCDNSECVKSQNFDIAVDELTKYIAKECTKARLEELYLINEAQQNEDKWSGFCMDDTSDFGNYIIQREAELTKELSTNNSTEKGK